MPPGYDYGKPEKQSPGVGCPMITLLNTKPKEQSPIMGCPIITLSSAKPNCIRTNCMLTNCIERPGMTPVFYNPPGLI